MSRLRVFRLDSRIFVILVFMLAQIFAFTSSVPLANAANHREAPISALDDECDIPDVFAFVSYDPNDPNADDKVTLIVTYDPFLEPGNGPTFFPFDEEALYAIRVDNDHDAVEDIVFEFRFQTETRFIGDNFGGSFTVYVGAFNGVPAPANAPTPPFPNALVVPSNKKF